MKTLSRKKSRRMAMTIVLLAGSLSAFAHAGAGRWRTGGPIEGAFARAILIDPVEPATIYAGTFGGFFKSTDAGDTWSPSSTGLTDVHISALASDSLAPRTFYAGTQGGGVFRTTDAGSTWAESGLAKQIIYAIAVDPRTSAIYAATWEQTIWEDAPTGISRSTDGGATWAASSNGLTAGVLALAIDPAQPATLYAGTSSDGVFKSTDSGGTWRSMSRGLPNPIVDALAIDPANPATLYAGTFSHTTNRGGVAKSTDAGTTWSTAGLVILRGRVSSLTIDRDSPATLYAGTGEQGVFKSTDAGTTWAATSIGMTNLNVLAVAIGSPATTLYVGTSGGGVFKSTNAGSSWAAAIRGLTSIDVRSLAVSGTSPFVIYAGSNGDGISRSTDAGSTWTRSDSGMTNDRVLALGIASGGTSLYAGTDVALFKSTDTGSSWKSSGLSGIGASITAIAVDPITSTTIYSGTQAGQLFKSTDAGSTWAASSTAGLNVPILALAIDPAKPATVYAGASGAGVFKSTDAGATWLPARTGMTNPWVTSLVVDPGNPAILYAGTNDHGGVFKSDDAGASWSSARTGLANASILSLAIDSATATLFAGASEGRVYRSTDAGSIWTPVGSDLPAADVAALAIDPTGKTVFAGLSFGSVWQYSLGSGMTALLPSSAHASGLGGASYTTDLTVANAGTTPTTFVLKFLGNNIDGRGGAEKSFPIGAGASTTLSDVLGSVFGLTTDYGAIRITSPSDSLRVLSQTSTPGFGGTFGQSVPAARPEDLIIGGTPQSILGVREDASFRTNLVLANASEEPLDVDVTLSGGLSGSPTKRFTLPPLGMTQVNRVLREFGVTTDVTPALLTVSTPSVGKSFAAYASLIDNVTNDPRTLLPVGPIGADRPSPDDWFLPSSAHGSGAGGAFYKTDLTVYTNVSVSYTLKFLGHDMDGRGGPEARFDLSHQTFVWYTDVLREFFQETSDYGAIRIAVQYPAMESSFIGFLAQTWTPGFGGTFGQSVPVATTADLIRTGTAQSILAVREDDSFRTNLILTNATEAALDVDVGLVSADGTVLATKRYSLAPLGMTQVTRVVRELGVTANVDGARLVLSTPTPNGTFAAYASAIDNVTNDPRTLLPR